MTALYNLLAVLVVAVIVKLGVKYTDYEEIFVAMGVVDIVYLCCVIIYMLVG